MNINVVCLSGNLTRDPEMRASKGGTPIMRFGIAVNEKTRNAQTGQWDDYTNFIDCTMFSARAEAVSKYLKKGMKVSIKGRLHYSLWERDGQKRSKLEVLVDEIELPARVDAQHAPQQAPQVQGAPQQVLENL